MITQATRVRLLIFAVITLVGIAYVGARYAQVDRLFVDRTYDVTVDLSESGGIFVGADVSYRGVSVGRVSELELSETGVHTTLSIDDSHENIPSDLEAVVADKSAVGEQYVDLQPRTDSEPYLADGSVIEQADTSTPISTQDLLANVSSFVGSVNTRDLRTVVHELGVGFDGTGQDISKIIDTSNSFIETANDEFGVTAQLIRDGSTVLDGQLAVGSSIRSFSRDLADFSDALRDSDPDLRSVLEDAPESADEISALLDENKKSIGELIGNFQSLNRLVVTRLPGLRGVLVLAPYAVENGFSVLSKDRNGKYEIRLAMAVSSKPPYCKSGYLSGADVPDPSDTSPGKLVGRVCNEPASKTNARGVQNAASTRTAPVAGVYDEVTGEFSTDVPDGLYRTAPSTDDAPPSDSWTNLLMAPSVTQ
ncbi:MCE family protein [Solicola gregarius]|uniref:MCE family protein n=1 Tax=Solicola gregarius TaxID=2908642 RepID=A0AA46TE75_9ACTN|nr:MlaD family protein [Solicola gregarius]UYM03729.1 MCE family protein [Solicola gregarius]